MKIRLSVFGVEVFCLSFGDDALDSLARLLTSSDEEDEGEDEEENPISGGSSHNFERDTTPLSPDDRYDWGEWKFGFGKP